MYCIKCGVELSETEKRCPLCDTVVYHPTLKQPVGERLYPLDRKPVLKVSSFGIMMIITLLFLSPAIITFLCDMRINSSVTWSGYVMGALFVCYFSVALPFWFRKPNPVIFVPCAFVSMGLYLLYISLVTNGGWFLSFAFPILGANALIITTVVTLVKYLRKGRLYVFGGAFIAYGALMFLIELLLCFTFDFRFTGWFIYPTVPCVLLGGLLIFFAICRPARESMERRFFI